MEQTSQVKYFAGDKSFIIKLVGMLRFTSAHHLDLALQNIKTLDSDKEVIIDLTETQFVDSTILGCFAKFFLNSENQKQFLNCRPTMVCKNVDVQKAFKKIGFDQFFKFIDSDSRLEQSNDYVIVNDNDENSESIRNHVLKAHQLLDQMQPKEEFKLVVKSLKDK